jgi:hypothetical protein
MRDIFIDIAEYAISSESLLIHHTERLEYPHLEYSILRDTHILCLAYLDTSREILIESS